MKTAQIIQVLGLLAAIVIGTFGLRQSIVAAQETPPSITLTPSPSITFASTLVIGTGAETAAVTPLPSAVADSAEQFALAPVESNADWTPVKRDFDEVSMVLVPAGCFMMGNFFGNQLEQPMSEQCLDAPFWIDETEVTQADFVRLGGVKEQANAFEGDTRPVESITWVEARDFCQLRGMRLPTEREWEYAARGPDNWVYPWGNDSDDEAAVWRDNSNTETAAVGSQPTGASWVGALDMAGNVWEWTNSVSRLYPYDVANEPDDESEEETNISRIARGGSFSSLSSSLRSSYRLRNYDFEEYYDYGFRCAVSASVTAPQSTAD
jgi:iron(II)-dependent oxidoreductase